MVYHIMVFWAFKPGEHICIPGSSRTWDSVLLGSTGTNLGIYKPFSQADLIGLGIICV